MLCVKMIEMHGVDAERVERRGEDRRTSSSCRGDLEKQRDEQQEIDGEEELPGLENDCQGELDELRGTPIRSSNGQRRGRWR